MMLAKDIFLRGKREAEHTFSGIVATFVFGDITIMALKTV